MRSILLMSVLIRAREWRERMSNPEDREAAFEEIARRMRSAVYFPPESLRFHFGMIAGTVHQEWPVFDYSEIDGWYTRWKCEQPEPVSSS